MTMQGHRMLLMIRWVFDDGYRKRLLWRIRLTVIQSNTFSNMSTSLKGSAGRLGRMAASGNKIAIFKLAGMIIGSALVLWFIWGLFV
jgi:hypothetical protein